jgi:hypothetical protein
VILHDQVNDIRSHLVSSRIEIEFRDPPVPATMRRRAWVSCTSPGVPIYRLFQGLECPMSILERFKRWRLSHQLNEADAPADSTTAEETPEGMRRQP